MGYSSEDIGWKDTFVDLKIEVEENQGVTHEYSMRAVWPVDVYEKTFKLWRKLIKGEKYVCVAGSFNSYEKKTVNGMSHETYSWTFDKIKTKKGSDSYFD